MHETYSIFCIQTGDKEIKWWLSVSFGGGGSCDRSICWHWFPPFVLLERSVTANQYKVTFICKYVYPDGSALLGWQWSHSQGTRSHWMIWWVWKWYISYAMATTVTRSEPSWAHMGEIELACWTTTIIKIVVEGICFKRTVEEQNVHHSSIGPKTCTGRMLAIV